MSTAYKKRIPNTNELTFIQAAGRIIGGQVQDAQELKSSVRGSWLDIALVLYEAYCQDGADEFWAVYDASANDRPQLDEWREMVKVAPEQAGEPEDPHFTKGKSGKRVLKFASIEDMYALPDPEYIINHVIETASSSVLYGVSGTGKTFTALDLALCIAHGARWHGRKAKQGVVWYINTEGGRGLKKRLKAWYLEHSHLSETPDFKIIPWSLDLKENFQDFLDTLEDATEKPVLIIADNFSMCTPGVEQNKQEQVSPILRAINQVVQDYGCHFMLIHHTNKEGDFNGTMAFRNHVDVMIELRKEDKTHKQSPILFSSQKARDDEMFKDIRTELKQVTLHYDAETLEPVTSCVVVDTEQPEPEKATPEIQINMLRLLKAHVKLTCNQWQKYSEETHQITRATFYRVRSIVEREGLITTADEKSRGKTVYYSLTEKGEQTVD
jgi:hypothetical protein